MRSIEENLTCMLGVIEIWNTNLIAQRLFSLPGEAASLEGVLTLIKRYENAQRFTLARRRARHDALDAAVTHYKRWCRPLQRDTFP
jgi:hypothetical protein